MSKKKNKKGVASRCYCGKRLRKKDEECRRCKRVTAKGVRVRMAKAVAAAPQPAAPAFLAKAYGANVVPLRAPRRICWSGEHVNKASAQSCTTCGTRLAATYGEHLDRITKAHRAAGYVPSVGAGIDDPDPARRELAWRMLHGQNGGAAS